MREPGPVDNSATGVTGHPPRIRRANTTNGVLTRGYTEFRISTIFHRFTHENKFENFISYVVFQSEGKEVDKVNFHRRRNEESRLSLVLYFLFCISFEDDYSSIDRLKRGFLFSRWKDNFFALHQLGNILARFF